MNARGSLVRVVVDAWLPSDAGEAAPPACDDAARRTTERLEHASLPVRAATTVLGAALGRFPAPWAATVMALPLPGVAEVARVIRSVALSEHLEATVPMRERPVEDDGGESA